MRLGGGGSVRSQGTWAASRSQTSQGSGLSPEASRRNTAAHTLTWASDLQIGICVVNYDVCDHLLENPHSLSPRGLVYKVEIIIEPIFIQLL